VSATSSSRRCSPDSRRAAPPSITCAAPVVSTSTDRTTVPTGATRRTDGASQAVGPWMSCFTIAVGRSDGATGRNTWSGTSTAPRAAGKYTSTPR
jgi:hypothetical protein